MKYISEMWKGKDLWKLLITKFLLFSYYKIKKIEKREIIFIFYCMFNIYYYLFGLLWIDKSSILSLSGNYILWKAFPKDDVNYFIS